MKKLLLPFICLLSISVSSCGEEADSESKSNNVNTGNSAKPVYQPGSPEEFANMLANFVIDSNYAGIDSLIIRKDEMVELISGSSVTPEGKQTAIAHVETEIGKMKIDMSNGLKEIRTSGATSMIAWNNCTFKEARYTINNPTGYDMMQLKCVLQCNGMEHVFTVTDVVRTKNGWRMGGKMMFGDVSQ